MTIYYGHGHERADRWTHQRMRSIVTALNAILLFYHADIVTSWRIRQSPSHNREGSLVATIICRGGGGTTGTGETGDHDDCILDTTPSSSDIASPSSMTVEEDGGINDNSIINDDKDGNAVDVFSWARSHGAQISSSIEIKETSYGGKGIFATTNIPKNAELIRIPYHLQFGVRQLAMREDSAMEMQSVMRSLNPWTIIKNELGFVPLSLALIAERRRGPNSLFELWLNSLPSYCDNSVWEDNEDGNDVCKDSDIDNLQHWAPHIANKIRQRRRSLQSLHQSLHSQLPSQPSSFASISKSELQWAASNVCSRSLTRKRIPAYTSIQTSRIGEFAAADHSRMLPIIDMVNHDSLQHANVWVGHLPSSATSSSSTIGISSSVGTTPSNNHEPSSPSNSSSANVIANEGNNAEEENDYSTSLKATRDIAKGEELLFDYGGGRSPISNDRLLIDYGFVLPGHTERVSITLDEFRAGVDAIDVHRGGMSNVAYEDLKRLDELIAFLTGHLSEIPQNEDPIPLLFFEGGEPNVRTLAVAIAMTCRDGDDVQRVLMAPILPQTPMPSMQQQQKSADASLQYSHHIIQQSTELQREFARYVLKVAAGLALEQRPSINGRVVDGKLVYDFEHVVNEYCKLCKRILREVADMSR